MTVEIVSFRRHTTKTQHRGEINMEKGVSKALMILVGIAIFGILVVVITNAFVSANGSSEGFQKGLCLNVPGLNASDCQ